MDLENIYWLILFVLSLISNGVSSYSFLEKLPDNSVPLSYESEESNESKNKTQYFTSERIQLNWVEAFTFCQANGLRLAKFPVEIEKSSRNITNLPHNEVFFDGSNVLSQRPCVKWSSGEIENVSCTAEKSNFLCETIDEVSDIYASTGTFPELDPGSTLLLKHIGDYNESAQVLKKYYIGSSDLSLMFADSAMFCQSMNMMIASPENKLELTNLKQLLNSTQVKWNQLQFHTIPLKQNPFVNDCYVFDKISEAVEKVSCISRSQVLCERNIHSTISQHGTHEDTKFVKPFMTIYVNSSEGLMTKNLFKNQNFLKTSWLGAHHICKSFGLDLFVPESEYEFQNVKNFFETMQEYDAKYNVNFDEFFIGATKLESSRWYSIINSEPLNYDLNFSSETSDDDENCAMMQFVSGELQTVKVNCELIRTNLICQQRFFESKHEAIETEAVFVSESDEDVDNEPTFTLMFVQVPDHPLVEAPITSRMTASCERQKDIFNDEGQYLKTACLRDLPTSREEGCSSIGMNLYFIDSEVVEREVLSFATNKFGIGGGSVLWVDFKRVKGERNYPSYAYESYCPIIRAWGNFETAYYSCNAKMFSICEYQKPQGSVEKITTTTEASSANSIDSNDEEIDSSTKTNEEYNSSDYELFSEDYEEKDSTIRTNEQTSEQAAAVTETSNLNSSGDENDLSTRTNDETTEQITTSTEASNLNADLDAETNNQENGLDDDYLYEYDYDYSNPRNIKLKTR